MSSSNQLALEPNDEEVCASVSYKAVDHSTTGNDLKEALQRLSILARLDTPELRAKYWSKLLETGKDTPGCILEMVQMNPRQNFPFHVEQADDEMRQSKWHWVFRKLQVSPKHRLEMIPTNVHLSELVRDLNELNTRTTVIFNLTKNSELLDKTLFHLVNLEWLNLSDCNLSIMKVRNIVHAMNRGNLKHLKALILTGNPAITVEGLHSELAKVTKGELQYIELSPIGLAEKVRETSILRPLELRPNTKLLNDAKRFKFLLDEKVIVSHNHTVNNIWIDYCVCNDGWGERVKIGLASSVKSVSFKVVLQREQAARAERVLGEKISRSMIRGDFNTDERPVLKKRKGGYPSFYR